MTTIGLILAVIFLDGWLRIVVIGGLLVFEVIEISIWLRWRKRRSITGSGTMVGEEGLAVTDCRPSGQVKLRGQHWSATCPQGVSAGESVVVTAIRGLKLEVTPDVGAQLPSAEPPHQP
jgi:membrane protein implicated in regulation of membrane protease activity